MPDTVAPEPGPQPRRTSTEELAISRELLAKSRAVLADSQSKFVAELVGLAFQLGRLQGEAEAHVKRLTQLADEHTRTEASS